MTWSRLGTRGSAAIEFATAGFAFVLFLVMAFETALQLAVGAALDRGARLASRAGALGSLAGDASAQVGLVKKLVTDAAPGLLTEGGNVGGTLTVVVQSFPGFGDIGNPVATRPGAGDPSQVARYTIVYQKPLFSQSPLLIGLLGANYIEHRAVLLVKNEPARQL